MVVSALLASHCMLLLLLFSAFLFFSLKVSSSFFIIVLLEKDGERETFSELVGTLRGSSSLLHWNKNNLHCLSLEYCQKNKWNLKTAYPDTSELVEHPRLGGIDSLKVFLRTASLWKNKQSCMSANEMAKWYKDRSKNILPFDSAEVFYSFLFFVW